MSTFDGIVAEFPNIRIDYFRIRSGYPPPAACFLSHVHSDHLQGLESLKMPFVYCSMVTKRILLKMEKYPHRINFARGILEARKQTYKHLRLVVRALPLQTPVELELGPQSRIRVTLFDANHCPGAVMFLIEGDGKAILYTGDMRAESWWVNSIMREPSFIPYTSGHSRLDCIYMDTTFASHDDIYRDFPPKAEGLKELLQQIAKYPEDSIFYFRAWTLGYEDVWITLANILRSPVHVDSYQVRLFRSVAEDGRSSDQVAALVGFELGNQYHPGCLSTDTEARIHSCEPGTPCHSALLKMPNVVWVTPIISRLRDGTEVAELGAGGGGGDLYSTAQLEFRDGATLDQLQILCRELVSDSESLKAFDLALDRAKQRGEFTMNLEDFDFDSDTEISIKEFLQHLSKSKDPEDRLDHRLRQSSAKRQKTIHFPYSRHSSYNELRQFVSALQPRDICPCTVDIGSWSEEMSMQSLFGDLCSESIFNHDKAVRARVEKERRMPSCSPQSPKIGTGNERSINSDQEKSNNEAQLGTELTCQSLHNDRPKRKTSHSLSGRLETTCADLSPDKSRDQAPNRPRLSTAWQDMNEGSDMYHPSQSQLLVPTINKVDSCEITKNDTIEGTQQIYFPSARANGDDCKGDFDDVTESDLESSETSNISFRRQAYEAARYCLQQGDSVRWENLHLRSLGWVGHTEEELEL